MNQLPPDPDPADPAADNPAADFAPPEDAPKGRDPFLDDSVLAEELFDRAVREAAAGAEEDAVVHFLRASKHAETAREWYLAALALHRVGDVFRTPGPSSDLERAIRMYRRAVAAYEQCGQFAEARQLSYDVTRLRLSRGRELGLSWALRAELFVFWLVAGFGYRPARVLASAIAVVLGYTLVFWLIDGVTTPDAATRIGFWECLYFSGTAFTTIGFGDMTPAPHARLLALSEGGIGVFAMGFFVVVLANRLRH